MRRRIPEDRVEGLLGSLRGLTGDEVRVRRLRHGANDVIEDSRGEAFELLRETVRDPMIGFLIGTGVLYALIGERPEAITLLVSILPLAGMDAYLHRRTRVATAGLRSRLSPRVTVDRDARTVEVPAIELVPGDLAIVSAGDTFPADGVIEAGVDLQVDEAMLTGEANPARKQALRPAASLGGQGGAVDERHWGFAGTRILTGRAQVRVVNTGAETLYGEIVRSARSGARSATPLQREVGRLVAALVIAASALCVFVGAVRLIQGYGWFDALLSAITLAVAALPEEFPIVFTVFLGVGVLRLARRGALVRRAVCVESIGRVSCICADKTGTLTLGELHLTHRIPIEGVTEDQLLETAARASRAGSGDALDVAIERAMRAHSLCGADTEILATFPFTEERRRETVVELDDGGRLQVAVKGAPEVVLSACDLSPAARRDWLAQVDSLAREGHKLIAVAEGARPRSAWTGEEPAEGLRFVGMIACEDPVRAGVAAALATCRAAGIRTVLVTGDHPATARAVAAEIGLGGDDPQLVTGEELDRLLSRATPGALRALDVVARAYPAQKLALVRALQASGETVAVTGDGVNDVPALRAADIGIAMGTRGTRSAREVAGIVLLEEDFGTIVRAIEEGRQLLRNLAASFEYLMLVHLPLVASAAIVPLVGHPLLYLPIHVVWLELMIHPSAMLAFQSATPSTPLHRRADRGAGRIFDRADVVRIAITGALVTGLVVWGYLRSLGIGREVDHARAMAIAVLTLTSAGIVCALSGLRSRSARWIVLLTLLASVLGIQLRPLATRLHLHPLHGDDWLLAAAASLVATGLVVALRTRRTRH